MRRPGKIRSETYRAKRDFGITAEPKGKIARKRGNAFVIQKHAATRLHYDLRLELDGVMKSWAVTRGRSLVPGEKRWPSRSKITRLLTTRLKGRFRRASMAAVR